MQCILFLVKLQLEMIYKTIIIYWVYWGTTEKKKPMSILVYYPQIKHRAGIGSLGFPNTKQKLTEITSDCCIFPSATVIITKADFIHKLKQSGSYNTRIFKYILKG